MINQVKLYTDIIYGIGLFWNAFVFVIQAYKIKRNRDVSGLSLFMFIGFNVGQILAVLNGVAYHDPDLFYGFSLSFLTCFVVTLQIVYYRYYKSMPAKVALYLLGSMLLFAALCVYVLNLRNFAEVISWVFAAQLVWNAALFIPQLVTLINTKNTQNLSLIMMLSFNVSQALSVVNGFLYHDVGFYWGSALSFVCALAVTVAMIRYRFFIKTR